MAKLPQLTLKPLNRREWVHHVVIWTQIYVRMSDMLLLACLYEFDEHHVRFKVYLIRQCSFCVFVQQTSTVTHMGINMRLGAPKIGETTLQCKSILMPNGSKLQPCLKLSTTLRFLASYVSHKCIFQARKVVLGPTSFYADRMVLPSTALEASRSPLSTTSLGARFG